MTHGDASQAEARDIVLPPVEALDGQSPEVLIAVATRAAALQAAAMAQLALARTASTPPAAAVSAGRALPAEEAAARLGISVPTLYRRAKSYPFARRSTPGPRGALRFDEAHLERWLAQRRP